MEIVINHLTRMGPPHICVAGFDRDAMTHVRPVLRYGRLTHSDLQANRGIFAIGARVDLGAVVDVGQPPELEDRQFTPPARLVSMLSGPSFWGLLQEISRPTLAAIFGDALTLDPPGLTLAVGSGASSLGCLWPRDTPRLYVNPKGQVRMLLADGGTDLNLSVTDVRLYEDDLRTPNSDRINAVADRLRRGVEVVLAVGVGRAYPPDEPRHWLQVNNVHFKDDPLGLRLG